MTTLPSSGTKRRALYRNLMFGLVLAFTALVVASRLFGIHPHGLASVLLIATLVVAVLQFQSLDEVAKQAHYVAWLWGSMAVMGLVGAGMALLSALPGPVTLPVEAPLIRFFGDANPDTAFIAGFITTPLLMVAGFTVWWVAYWLRRR